MKLSLSLFLLLACPAMADRKVDLVLAMERSGSHEYKDERRKVELDGCRMTTYRWRNLPEHGWVLWTSFQFQMDDARLDEDKRFPGKKYAYARLEEGPPEIGFAFYSLTLREGAFARQERSVLREPTAETQPSPRGDGTTHYYQQLDSILISLEGPGVEEKAITFTRSYDDYVNEYCTSSS